MWGLKLRRGSWVFVESTSKKRDIAKIGGLDVFGIYTVQILGKDEFVCFPHDKVQYIKFSISWAEFFKFRIIGNKLFHTLWESDGVNYRLARGAFGSWRVHFGDNIVWDFKYVHELQDMNIALFHTELKTKIG